MSQWIIKNYKTKLKSLLIEKMILVTLKNSHKNCLTDQIIYKQI